MSKTITELGKEYSNPALAAKLAATGMNAAQVQAALEAWQEGARDAKAKAEAEAQAEASQAAHGPSLADLLADKYGMPRPNGKPKSLAELMAERHSK
jgi:ribosomal protein L11